MPRLSPEFQIQCPTAYSTSPLGCLMNISTSRWLSPDSWSSPTSLHHLWYSPYQLMATPFFCLLRSKTLASFFTPFFLLHPYLVHQELLTLHSILLKIRPLYTSTVSTFFWATIVSHLCACVLRCLVASLGDLMDCSPPDSSVHGIF